MTPINVLLSAAVGAVFWLFVFGKLVVKHTARIASYEEERHFFLKFFDVPAFLIMAVMMTGGISIRHSALRPKSSSPSSTPDSDWRSRLPASALDGCG